MPDRDDTPIPFTVADRVMLAEIHATLKEKMVKWDEAAARVTWWTMTGRWVQGIAAVALSWLLAYVSWHHR